MTIKDLKNILIHFQSDEYDDYQVVLWDYNHQEKLKWNVSHSLSHSEKELCFPVTVKREDGKSIFEELRNFCKESQKNGTCKKN